MNTLDNEGCTPLSEIRRADQHDGGVDEEIITLTRSSLIRCSSEPLIAFASITVAPVYRSIEGTCGCGQLDSTEAVPGGKDIDRRA